MPSAVRTKLIDKERGHYWIHCPACNHKHVFAVGTPFGNDAQWSFNGDLEKPSFGPSMLIRWPEQGKNKVCHFFVTDGMIKFQGDCTHQFRSKTLPLPPL
jgi:hypothetical protein